MNNITHTYDLLGSLLAYPDGAFSGRLTGCRESLAGSSSEARLAIEQFADAVQGMTIEDLQELYTHTFDLNPICSLELGWQLYGENYSRGEFLVEMRQTLRRLNVPETTELPDHITHVLSAFGRMSAKEANRFAVKILLPAAEKMQQGLSGKGCAYEHVLEAISSVILSPFGAALEEVQHG